MRGGLADRDDVGARRQRVAEDVVPLPAIAGGPILPGTQWISWIHRRDHIGLIQWALRASTLSGPLNAVALLPVTMNEFSETLGKVLHRPSWLPVPGLALNVALGELGTLMTTGQWVSSAKALSEGYNFQCSMLESALRDILVKR